MDRKAMKDIMMMSFKKSSFNHYVERGWIIPSDFNSFSQGVERIHRDSCPSFKYKDLWVSVDFAAGAGSKAGLPTNQKHITVFYQDKKTYHFERFTFPQFIKELWEENQETGKQLALF